MRTLLIALAATVTVATASSAPATEIAVPIDFPSFALPLAPHADALRYARYDLAGGLTVELVAQDGDYFGYWDSGEYDPLPDGNVAPFVEEVGDCGNFDACAPYVATFSAAVDGASVEWSGLLNASGSGTAIESGSFFLEAWSGPNGTGTLLARVTDPGGLVVESARSPGFYPLLSIAVQGIRSIVFAAEAVTDEYSSPVNLGEVTSFTVTIIPEPSTAALLALGLAALTGWGVRGSNPGPSD